MASSAAPSPTDQKDAERYQRLLAEARAIQGVSLGKDAWRRLKKNRVAMASLWFLVGLGVLAFLTPFLPLQPSHKTETKLKFAPPVSSPLLVDSYDIEKQGGKSQGELDKDGFGELNFIDRGMLALRRRVFGPWCFNSLCGRDKLGRDTLARLFWGARVSLLVGVVAAFVSLVIGVTYGAVSGYLGGWIDNLMMRIVEALDSVPFIFVVIFLITVLSQEDVNKALAGVGINRMHIFFVVVGAIYWLTMSRVVRGQVISLKNEQFIEAARTIGASRWRIIFRHLMPNLTSVVIVYLTLTIPRVILFEAFLSFVGLGVEVPNASWGVLANEAVEAITSVKVFWWLVVFPGAALAATLFALNFLGDGLRDALDPRLKNR
ncbi:MAG: ABC transporter permease [Planctomycetia bacterium]|nr:ABC transporter permease [Planctomycetia bacterium]